MYVSSVPRYIHTVECIIGVTDGISQLIRETSSVAE